MALSNREKQAAHRRRMREKGLTHFQEWVTPKNASLFRLIIENAAVVTPISDEAVVEEQTELAMPGTRRTEESSDLSELRNKLTIAKKDMAALIGMVDLFIQYRQKNKAIPADIFKNLCHSQLRLVLRFNEEEAI